jgi:hypothetical protein
MTSNGNQQEQATVSPAVPATPVTSASEGPGGLGEGDAPQEIVEVDELLAELADLDPADATGPAARVAELLGSALDREGR